MESIKKHIRQHKELLIVIALALIVRLIGINHGYPYVLNIDEPTIVRTTLGLNFSLIVDHFDWPHFSYYFNYIFYFLFIKLRGLIQILGLRSYIEPTLPILWSDPFVFYLISRIISAVLGALTIIPLYLLQKRLKFEKRSLIIGALFFAFVPYHVYISHIAIQDSANLFWVMWAVYYLHKAVFDNKLKDYLWSGIFLGISVGIKYNALLLVGLLPLFILETNSPKNIFEKMKKHFWPSSLLALTMILTFFATTWSLFPKWNIFWSHEYGKGILWQINSNVSSVHINEYGGNLIRNFADFSGDFGYAGMVLILWGVGLLLFNLKPRKIRKIPKGLISSLIILVFYFLYTSSLSRSPSHYFLLIYGLVSMLASYAIDFAYLKKRFIYSLAVFFVLIIMIGQSIYINYKFINKDTRTIAFGYYELTRNAGYSYRTYYNGEKLGITNGLNNMDIKKFRDVDELRIQDIVISIENFKINGLNLIETIDNKGRFGPVLYIFMKS